MAIKADPMYQSTYYYFAKYLYDLNRYDEAIYQLNGFNDIPNNPKFNKKKDGSSANIVKNATKLAESCRFAKEEAKNQAALNIQNMGPGINSKLWEYWPGMTIDGKYFIFTRRVDETRSDPGQEDFYMATRTDSGWTQAISLPGNINTPKNEGNTSVTPDGKKIYFTVCEQRDRNYDDPKEGFGSCDIYFSQYNAATNTWSKRYNLGPKVNSADWDAHPAISADGRSIIFASSRKGGVGGMDLWISHLENGNWTAAENMGNIINTADNESAPFLHYDGKTLYFSSNGHAGLGMQDIFFSRLGADGKWSKPENIGKGINTPDDEVGLYVEYAGKKGYFSSNRPGGFGGVDIYSFDLAPDKRPGPISYVLGKVLDDETRSALSGRIEIVDLNTNKIILKDSAADFFMTLEPGGNYLLNVYRQGYLPYSANFQPQAAKIDSPYMVTALLKKFKKDEHIVLQNIFFDLDKYDLKSESFTELNTVLSLMKSNPNMQIAIEGHTDNQGTAEHNQVLSENRAKSVANWLIGKGIAAKRLTSKGFGAEQPIANNSTENGRAMNRRIELRISKI
jgi:outer membrane protein OmpA-like peptidoglycan-associated protein/Tol biopolymer transport system component